jgi:L-alanine-DL-glutamate epimerase-like enolase superfamily enzyme
VALIESIRPFIVPYTEPNDHGSTRYVCLVRVTDSDGIVGWGEAVTLFREPTVAITAMIEAYRPMLEGEPADAAHVARLLDEHGWWFADTGMVSFVFAALDIALWDIAGKAAGLPLWRMLGDQRRALPIVVSCHATEAEIPDMVTRMVAQVENVHATGIKVGFGKRGDANLGFERERDVEFVRALRQGLGPDSQLMIDIGAKIRWSVDEAIDRIRAFEAFDVHWTEEPLGARSPGYRRLKEETTSLIAYGEREWGPAGYEEIMRSGTVDVVGVDPGRARGISGFRKVVALGEELGIQLNAHAFAGPVVFAASLALSQGTPQCHQLELMPLRNSLYDLCTGAPQPTDGTLTPNDVPGLGLEFDDARVEAVAEAMR